MEKREKKEKNVELLKNRKRIIKSVSRNSANEKNGLWTLELRWLHFSGDFVQ